MAAKKIAQTDHGALDAEVLAELQQSFATAELLAAIDAIDAGEGRWKWLHACLVRLHAMANHLVNGAPQTVTGEETIWQLAEEIGDEIDAQSAGLAHAAKLVDRLAQLRPDGAPVGD